LPELHDPVVVVAFTGWNDAASAATDAARFIVANLNGRRFASLDAEHFYDFRSARPSVASAGGARVVNWQKNEFFYARQPTGPHDVVVAIGVEPGLRWQTFAALHMDLYRQLKAGLIVSLGALLADVPHTRPPRVTGSAFDPDVAARLDLTTSSYEGPTGIVGVLHDELRRSGISGASLWANTPHYITTSQNPAATRALLVRLQSLIGVQFDLGELETAGERFIREVDTALSANGEVASYVRRLEEAYDQEPPEPEDLPDDLPTAGEAVDDVEDFLRRARGED
jgi:proteasome assembly chaperone (PAC2) family protein